LIKEKRTKDGFPVGFSLDAGPNIHLLYPEAQKNKVVEWLESELQQFCSGGKMIHDQVGNGPTITTK
jgi:diphosphomevalonate decarboxylase